MSLSFGQNLHIQIHKHQLLCQGLVVSEGETEVEGQEEGLTEELWIKYRCTILAQLY